MDSERDPETSSEPMADPQYIPHQPAELGGPDTVEANDQLDEDVER